MASKVLTWSNSGLCRFSCLMFINSSYVQFEIRCTSQRCNISLQSWTKYFEQTSILKKSLFSSIPLSNNVENVDNIHAGLAQLQHC